VSGTDGDREEARITVGTPREMTGQGMVILLISPDVWENAEPGDIPASLI